MNRWGVEEAVGTVAAAVATFPAALPGPEIQEGERKTSELPGRVRRELSGGFGNSLQRSTGRTDRRAKMLYLVTGIWKLTGHAATVPIHAESEERARFVAEWGGLIPTQIQPQAEEGASEGQSRPSRPQSGRGAS